MGQPLGLYKHISGRRKAGRRLRQALSIVLSLSLVLNGPLGFLATANAQVVSDPRAPIQFQPRVGTVPNGVPLIDITKPSFGGLSHNRYERLNVDTRGIILNNSGLGGTSILGGQIPGNPNLVGSRPASVILNEVTGPSASLLNGPTEVFGSKAEVIIANQHGVTCRSCSFINTGWVTLSTGVPIPDYQNGTVAFEVKRGTVRIEGTGVSSINAEGKVGKIGALDLVGRQIEADGRILSDNHVRMRSGAINWNQNSDVVTRLSGADIPAVSGPGISSTGNGLIEAGTISAISHDLNVGVSFAGDMTALGLEQPDGAGNTVQTNGLIVVSSQGDLAIAKSGSRGDIRLDAAGRLSFSGGQQAMGRITGFGNDIITDGSFTANDAIVLEAVRNITTRAQAQSGSAISIVGGGDVAASGLISASGMLAVEGANVSATDLQAAGSSVTVAGLGLISLDRTELVSATDLSVLSHDIRLGQGTAFQAGENQSGRIFLDARGTLTNATVLNYPNLTLNLGGSLINEAGGEIVFDNMRFVLTDRFVNAGVLYGRVSSLIEAQSFENKDTGTVYGPDVAISVKQNLINAGELLSEGNISVSALGAVINDGGIKGNGALTLRSASYTANSAAAILAGASADLIIAGAFDSAGTVQGANALALSAASANNRTGATLYGGSVNLALSGDLANAGDILSASSLTLTAGAVLNSGAVKANDALALNAASYTGQGAGSLLEASSINAVLSGIFASDGQVKGVNGVSVQATGLSNSAGAKVYGSFVDLALSGGALDNAGEILSLDRLSIAAGPISNSGVLQANGDITLTGTSYAGTGPASQLVGNQLTLSVSDAFSNDGQIIGRTGTTLTAGSLSNTAGATLYGTNVTLFLTCDATNAGEILSGSDLTLTGGVILNSGVIEANNTVTLNAASYTGATSAARLAGGTVTVTLSGVLSNEGEVASRNDLSVTAGSLANTGQGKLIGKAVDLFLSGDVSNTGQILSETGLSLTAVDIVNDGTVQANNDIRVNAASYASGSASSLLEGTNVKFDLAETLSNTGRITGRNNVTVKAEYLNNAAGAILNGAWVRADLHGSAALTNAGQILSGSDLLIVADTIINDGAMQARDDAFIDAESYTANTVTAVLGGEYVSLVLTGDASNAGRIVADDTLNISAASLTTLAGSSIGSYDVMLDFTGDVSNAGAIEALGLMNISAANLINTGKITAYEISWPTGSEPETGLVISGTIDNRGILQATNNLILEAATLLNASDATIQARQVSADITGAISNSGTILSDEILTLLAASLQNAGTAIDTATISGKYLQLTASGDISNGPYAVLQGTQSSVIEAETASLDLFHANDLTQGIFNYGKDLSLTLSNQGLTIDSGQSLIVDGQLDLNLSGDVIINGILASRNNLTLDSGGSITVGRNDAANPGGGEIFTSGNANLFAKGDITNYASLIQALGTIYLKADGTVTNTRTDQKFETGIYPVSLIALKYGWNNPDKYADIWERTSETSQAAQIWADGNILIEAGSFINDASTVYSGGVLQITAAEKKNLSRDSGEHITTYKVGSDTNVGEIFFEGYLEGTLASTTAAVAGAAGLVIVGGWVENTGLVQAPIVRIDAETLINGITDPNRQTAPSRLPDPVIDLSNYFTAPGSGSVSGQTGSSVYVPGVGWVNSQTGSGFNTSGSGSVSGPTVNTNVVVNGVKYKYSTPFPDESFERGPDWILEQVGDGRLPELTFFTDPTTEQRLITQALIDQTGSTVLDPRYRNPKEQQEALWQGTVDFLKDNPDIKLGDRLGNANRATIKEPILWYEERIIDGERVLVPQLILPETRLEEWRKTNGGVISAENLYLSGDQIYNTGSLLAENALVIDAGSFSNISRVAYSGSNGGNDLYMVQDGGVIAGDIVHIRTVDDLNIVGSRVSAGSDLSLVSQEGNVNIVSQLVQNTVAWDEDGKVTSVSMVRNHGSVVVAGGSLTIAADQGSLNLQASHLEGDGVSLSAGESINLLTGTDQTLVSVTGKSDDVLTSTYYNHGSEKQELVYTTIKTGSGDLSIRAPNIIIEYLETTYFGTRDKEGSQQIEWAMSQTPQEALAALASQPGMGWVNQLLNDPSQNIRFDGVSVTQTEWDHDQTVLSPVASAIISVLAAVVVPGIGSAVGAAMGVTAGAITGALANVVGQTVANAIMAALPAFASSVVSGTIIGAINGNLDFGNVLLGALASGITAGVLNGVNATFFANAPDMLLLPKSLGGMGLSVDALTADSLMQGVLKVATNAAITAGIRAGITGADFEDVFLNALRSAIATDLIQPIGYAITGDIIEVAGSIEASLLHAIVGGVSGAVTGGLKGAAGGALGAALGELVLSGDPGNMSQSQIQSMIIAQQLIGGLSSAVVGDDSMAGVSAAVNGFVYNFLNHGQRDQLKVLKEKIRECWDKENCDKATWDALNQESHDLVDGSKRNVLALQQACQAGATEQCRAMVAELQSFMQEVKAERDYYGDMGSYDRDTLTFYQAMGGFEENRTVNLDVILADEYQKLLDNPLMTSSQVQTNIANAILKKVKEENQSIGAAKATLSAAGLLAGGAAIVLSGGAATPLVAALELTSGGLAIVSSGSHLYGDAQQAVTGVVTDPGIVQLLKSGGVSAETALNVQHLIDIGAITVGVAAGGAAVVQIVKGSSLTATEVSSLERFLRETNVKASPSGSINQSKVTLGGKSVTLTNEEQSLAAKIMREGDSTGALTEQLVDSIVKNDPGNFKLLDGGKYGGNKGFDQVIQGPDGSIIILDSKQMNNGAFKLGTAYDGKVQLSDSWVQSVLGKLDPASEAYQVVSNALRNEILITGVAGVNKTTGELILLKVVAE